MNRFAARDRLRDHIRRVGCAVALLGVAMCASGCPLLGVAASAIPQPPIKPKHVLAGQGVGVMVWCDRATLIDWPTVQKDLGGGIQTRLREAREAKAEELEGMTLPWPAESFVRWQKDHPGYENRPVTEIAASLPKVTRLIYVELQDLSTRSSRAMALYRGSALASIKVIDVPPGATVGTVVYQEDNVRVVYPKKSNEEGRPDGDDLRMYAGTINTLADSLALRFIEHPAESEE